MIYRQIISQNGKKIKYKYTHKNGSEITNKNTLNYINKSKLPPPTYTNIEININKNAKYIATGCDKTGQKQYFYSEQYDKLRQKKKYCDLIIFSKHISKIRNGYNKYIKNNKMTKNKMISLILFIIEKCNFRIGSESCKRDYKTYGLTTLTKKHIKIISDSIMNIEFIGKKKQKNKCVIKDEKIIKIMRKITHNMMNGKSILWKYNSKNITANDVNNYLKSFDKKITAKIFRTWAANKLFIENMLKYKTIPSDIKKRKKRVKEINELCAAKLLHTVGVFKKQYQCPDLPELYIDNPKKFKKLIYINVNNNKNNKNSSNKNSNKMNNNKMNNNKMNINNNNNNNNNNGLNKSEKVLINFLNEYYNKKYCENI
tara:strand:+ start:2353 stop:3465 length:1113 start_codon:yes stop_codon:yes gene_type:complete